MTRSPTISTRTHTLFPYTTLFRSLTFSQYVTLKKLAIGSTGVTDLARAAELNPGAMTRLLDRLEAKGLVVRTADPTDRRALNIDLTDAGLAIWQEDRKSTRLNSSH